MKFNVLLRSCVLLMMACVACNPSENVIYVSTEGNDAWSGLTDSPNANQTDGPVASLERARELLREAGNTDYPVHKVIVRGGVYNRTTTFTLDAQDSGNLSAPNVWTAYPGETPILTGAVFIRDFQEITDANTLRRIHPEATGNVVVTDLRAQGITDFGEIVSRSGPGLELFFNDERMPLSRWPNEGFVQIAEVPQRGELIYPGNAPHIRFDRLVGKHYGRFNYAEDAPSRWTNTDQIILHGYWSWDWFDEFLKVDRIDASRKEIWIKPPHGRQGYTKEQRYYALNILEEIDQPGEWFLDRNEGLLYFWPPADVNSASVMVSLLETPLITLQNAEHIQVDGFTFAYTRGNALEMHNSNHSLLSECTIRHIGGTGAIILDGTHNQVRDCDIHHIGGAGVEVTGGERESLTPSHHEIVNNHIYEYSGWVRTYLGGVNVHGVGVRIANNHIHHAPHTGILVKGNEHIIEYNELNNLAQQTGDVGAFYIGRDWTERGNIVRHNYFHHMEGPGLHGVMAVYLDDWASGTTIYGNIFYRAGRTIFIGGGRDNHVENNLFIECEPSIHVDVRGRSWASYYFDKENPIYQNTMFDRMDAMKYNQPPYSERYPELLTYYDDEPDLPKNNTIIRNVSFGGTFANLIEGADFDMVQFRENLIADPIIATWERGINTPQEVYASGDTLIARELHGNTIMTGNPGIMDISAGDFRLRDDSPAFKMGFKRIPVEKIGLKRD